MDTTSWGNVERVYHLFTYDFSLDNVAENEPIPYCYEEAVRHEGGTQELIFDAIRLGSVVKGLYVALQGGAPLPQS